MRLHDGLQLDELSSAGSSTRSGCSPTTPTTARRGRPSRSSAPTTRHFRPLGLRAPRRQLRRAHARRGSVAACGSCSSTSPAASGCAMESLGHSLERMATCGALPYYERYFREYAMLDLDRRYGLPFESLYLKGPHRSTTRRPRRCATARAGAGTASRTTWRPAATSTSCPTAASTTTSTAPAPVLSTIETWRQPDQEARPWTPAVLDRYRELAPDCMGRWVVYWRQNMPGLGQHRARRRRAAR